MTLAQRYQQAKEMQRPVAPATAFILEVAALTNKHELTVRRWISGDAVPDALTQKVLADHFDSTPEQLFPKR